MSLDPGGDGGLLVIYDDEPPTQEQAGHVAAAWLVLVVDDDQDVHTATTLALAHLRILDRPLQLLHARSAAEALHVLHEHPGVAVMLLDVVMESAHAGLGLVHQVRRELGLSELRIVMRTGQPGYAPELETIRDYDINDYKTKSELTRPKLYATLTTAIRSFDQIHTINASRRGLNKIVEASGQLVALQGYREFTDGLITQIAALLRVFPAGVVCAIDRKGPGDGAARVVGAAGPYSAWIGCRVAELEDDLVRGPMEEALELRQSLFHERSTTLYLRGAAGAELVTYVATDRPISPVDQDLLNVFSINIALCHDNVLMIARLGDYAYVDQLLQMPNRQALIQRLDEIRDRQQQVGHALALVDIDQFSQYNNGLGYPFGDQLLRATAQRIRERLPSAVFVARISKDSFAVLGPEPMLCPEVLQGLFQEPLLLEGGETSIATTQGFVRLTDIPSSPGEEVIRCAGIALKHAKALHRGENSYFTASMGDDIIERVHLHQGLRQAIKQDHLFLVYQPQVSLPDGRPTGAEALLRWRTEDGQYVPPSRFIPVAESSGLMVSLGDWVLRKACEELRRILDRGYTGFRMSVNVSMLQFAHPQFLERLDLAIADTGIPPNRLELEVTESIASLEMERIVLILQSIRTRGVSVAIDDFGTGFSSLSYLERLAIDRLKIDRAFVARFNQSADGERIAAAVVDLGHKLKLRVIAEGVETEEQAQWLHQLGCHEAQGFLYAKPMEAQALAAWLASQRPA